MSKPLPPHVATLASSRTPHVATTAQLRPTRPHAATVLQPRSAPPALPERARHPAKIPASARASTAAPTVVQRMDLGVGTPTTMTLGELFSVLTWRDYARQNYQKRIAGKFLPSRYVMIDCGHIANQGHLTFYPADPLNDAVSKEAQDVLDYGYQDGDGQWQECSSFELDQWLDTDMRDTMDSLAFKDFHFTFTDEKKQRKHVYFDLRGNVTSGGEGFPSRVLSGAKEIAGTVANAVHQVAHQALVRRNMERFVHFMATTTASGADPPSLRERLARLKKKRHVF